MLYKVDGALIKTRKPSSLPLVALGEWLMILPATVFLAAAALRFLQPPVYEPAHTSWIIVQWTTAHISPFGAALLFIAVPGLVAMIGCVVLFATWRDNQALREDLGVALGIFRRQWLVVVVTTATLLAGCILALAVAHIITD